MGELKTNSPFKENNQVSSRIEKQAKINVKSFTDALESITINKSTNETEGLNEIKTGPRVNKEEEGSFIAENEKPSSSVDEKETEACDPVNAPGDPRPCRKRNFPKVENMDSQWMSRIEVNFEELIKCENDFDLEPQKTQKKYKKVK